MPDDQKAEDEGQTGTRSGRRFIVTSLKWWLASALIVTIVLAAVALVLNATDIEEDLRLRVSMRMEQAGQNWVAVEVDGRDVILTGTAEAEVRRLEAREIAAAVWGVAAVRDRTVLIPLVTPFNWVAEKDGAFVILTGHVPSADTQATIMDLVTAILPQTAVEDRTELARGVPPDFRSGVEFALRVLANLASGAVEVAGLDISAEGLAFDLLRYENAIEITQSGLPPGFAVIRAEILPPLARPYVWSVTISEAVTVITGSVPSTGIADLLASATFAAFGGAIVEDRAQLASGQPPEFEDKANRALFLASLLSSGEVVLTDSSLSISGRARSPEAYETALALLAAEQPAGLTIAYQDVAPLVAAAYVLEVVRSGDGVELIGFMPSEEARIEVLAEAIRLFGVEQTEDRLQIADGAPRMDWIGAAKFALSQVAALSGGSARISDHSFSITGAAATSESYESLRAALAGTLPASLVLNNVLLSAPVESPYRFTAAVGPEAVTLTGVVPSPETRSRFTTEVGLRFSQLGIVNETLLASGAPVGFEAAVIAGLQAISRLEAGRFELIDLAVSVTGVAPYRGAIDRIEEQLRAALPAEFSFSSSLTGSPAQSQVSAQICRELLVAELGEGGIKFSEGSAAIAPESEGRIDRLVSILQRCSDAQVEIGGHTDSGGTAARNQALSQIRAEAVVDYLERAGIEADRLAAVGYGEMSPIASNETEEGRAQNRRIEFTIIQP